MFFQHCSQIDCLFQEPSHHFLMFRVFARKSTRVKGWISHRLPLQGYKYEKKWFGDDKTGQLDFCLFNRSLWCQTMQSIKQVAEIEITTALMTDNHSNNTNRETKREKCRQKSSSMTSWMLTCFLWRGWSRFTFQSRFECQSAWFVVNLKSNLKKPIHKKT